MKLFNTLSGKKEPVAKPKNRPLHLFVCGPTVYDEPHIGNARTFVAFDALVRTLTFLGLPVDYLQNITDIDDKIIQRAQEAGVSWEAIAREYEKSYLATMKTLGVSSVKTYARATDYIDDIVEQVQLLIKRKHVYKIEEDGYYFDLSTFPSYGKLSRRTATQAEDGVSRIDDSDKKKNRGDFCVWKLATRESSPAEPSWKTALGAGRPGWHIEDTAITHHFFGPQYDIHGGANDLKFPHHEAEIAQAESAYGKRPFVKMWVHAGFLTVNGQKMSKSLHNFVTVSDMLKKFSPNAFRLLVLSSHYRSPIDYTETLMTGQEEAYRGIMKFLAKCNHVINAKAGGRNTVEPNAVEKNSVEAAPIETHLATLEEEFRAALEDDFNTPGALAAIFSFMNEVNPRLWKLSKEAARDLLGAVATKLEMLGFTLSFPKTPKSILELVKNREAFRKRKQFMESDRLRKQLESLGYSIEDTPAGPFLWYEI